MRYAVVHQGVVIGYSDLEERDEAAGVALGVLHPTPAYERLRAVFRAPGVAAAAAADGAEAPSPAFLAALADVVGLGLTLRQADDDAPVASGPVLVQDYTPAGAEGAPDMAELLLVSVVLPLRVPAS